jgi:hypothetical protein
MRWAGHEARTGKTRNAYGILASKPEGKKPFGRARRRQDENIRMNLREMGVEVEDWMHLAQDRTSGGPL